MRVTSYQQRSGRRGVVLLVVLALLTLFAVVGVAFVFYSEQEALTASLFNEAEEKGLPDPDLLGKFALNQIILDSTDPTSALQTHSLLTNMYGPGGNIPFNGSGRLHTGGIADEYYLLNFQGRTYSEARNGSFNPPYTYPDHNNAYLGAVDGNGRVLARSFVRYCKVPLEPDGNPTTPDYFFFDPYDPANAAFWTDPNWFPAPPSGRQLHRQYNDGRYGAPSTTGPVNDAIRRLIKRAMVLRPLPYDHEGFPPLMDIGGDVKNLPPGTTVVTSNPGIPAVPANDSIWVDLGYPVQTGRDGRRYKPLFAFFIQDLDGKVNLNLHGNARGTVPGGARTHVSNQGWGRWEVNLGHVLTAPDIANPALPEWPRLFRNNPSIPTPFFGLYGPDGEPGNGGPTNQMAWMNSRLRRNAQVDYDACRFVGGVTVQTAGAIPVTLPPGASFPPAYPPGYDNGTPVDRVNHPALFPQLYPNGNDRVFRAENMEALLRHGDTGTDALVSDLRRILPNNFNDPKIRRLVTTHSLDVYTPGVTPWAWSAPGVPPYAVQPNALDESPIQPGGANGIPFPPVPPGPPGDGEFGANAFRALNALLGRVDLNRYLRPYPHQGLGVNPNGSGYATVDSPRARLIRHDTGAAVLLQAQMAQRDRQQLANDIYRRLIVAVGLAHAYNAEALGLGDNPTDQQLMAFRWLAQLAVNIVDFIDEDDICTPFNFYTAFDASGNVLLPSQAFNPGQLSGNNPELPRYWVFGTELPRVVLSEVLIEADPPDNNMPGMFDVKIWVELYNTTTAGANPARIHAEDAQPETMWVADPDGAGPLTGFSPYRLLVANTVNPNNGGPLLPRPGNNDNVLGAPQTIRAGTKDTDWDPAQTPIGQVDGNPQPALDVDGDGNADYPSPYINRQGFMLIGPPGNTVNDAIVAVSNNGTVPDNTPWLQTPNMQYTVNQNNNGQWTPDDRANGLTILLRRLANPHLPYQPDPNAPLYNPYVTMDYMERLPISNVSGQNPRSRTRVKRQPYTSARFRVVAHQPNPGPDQTSHSFGLLDNGTNSVDAAQDWLVHLDRQLVSTMELLHVSGFKPHELTHRFYHDVNGNGSLDGVSEKFQHLTNRGPGAGPNPPTMPFWFDQRRRLYRVLEFLEARSNATEVQSTGTRINLAAAGFTPGNFPGVNTVVIPAGTQGLIQPGMTVLVDAGTAREELVRVAAVTPTTFTAFFRNNHPGNILVNANLVRGQSWGKININTVWDLGILAALCDPQPANSFNAANVTSLFAALLSQRSPGRARPGPVNYFEPGVWPGPYRAGPGAFDRPFMSLATGFTRRGTDLQHPDRTSGINDTVLAASSLVPGRRLFEVPNPNPDHPIRRYELLTKIFNNITVRSNVFAIWITVGFFEVKPPDTRSMTPVNLPGGNPAVRTVTLPAPANTLGISPGKNLIVDVGVSQEIVRVLSVNGNTFTAAFTKSHMAGFPISGTLGGEIGRLDGRHIRHRYFAIVDRTAYPRFSPVVPYRNYDPTKSYVLGPATSTNPTAAIAAGSQSVFVTTAGWFGSAFPPGSTAYLVIDSGTLQEEVVRATVTGPSSFVAVFARPHSAAAGITGYPMPTGVLHWSVIE